MVLEKISKLGKPLATVKLEIQVVKLKRYLRRLPELFTLFAHLANDLLRLKG
jgi:hypothetical protein